MFEKKMMHKKKGKAKIVQIIVVCVVTAAILCGGSYVNDYYEVEPETMTAFDSDENVTVSKLSDDTYVFMPKEPVAGLIFYPGGKVEHEAYGTLMQAYARQGICCVLVKMPLRLAVLDVNAADGIIQQYPEITRWYMGGHSLGGSMAASYVAEHHTEFEGLLLFAAYSTADLSESGLRVLSIYGSQDKVLNLEKYEAYRENLPTDTEEKIIEGGCHAYFGSYGEQDGDGIPTITVQEQMTATVEYSMEFMMEDNKANQ